MTDAEMEAARNDYLAELLDSDAAKKVVVAGPGTGKTHAFRELISRTTGAVLVLSFLGNLVADLAEALGDSAEVYTFHAFCRRLLHSSDVEGVSRGVDYYPELPLIVDEDLALVDHPVTRGDVERSLMNLDDRQGHCSAGLRIGDYYDAVGHTDSVYRVHRALLKNPALAPTYAQIVVDEYQDFSRLETTLIDQLSERSPVLIAGDDDQALYSFKHASADYLRAIVQREDYEQFELPFCSRCPSVLVEATHTVVDRAQQQGLLVDRLDKQYICYLPGKRAVSALYPKIIHAHCTVERNNAPYACRYISEQIASITPEDVAASQDGKCPTVLVVAPTQFGRRVYQHLVDAGVPNVEYRSGTPQAIDAIAGYERLVRDARSRLGWRILLYLNHPTGWDDWVRRALLDGLDLVDLLEADFKERHLAIAALLARLMGGETLSDEERSRLETAGLDVVTLSGESPEQSVVEDDTAPSVIITSLLGAKGLQAEHVYVVGLNDGHFPRDNSHVTDDEVCQLLVALTRGKQSCTLISMGRFGNEALGRSVFADWLQPLSVTRHINAAHWQH